MKEESLSSNGQFIKKNSFDKKSSGVSGGSASVSANGGFMKCDKISDLNQAIDDLDDTQFRGSIKAGSRGSNGTSNINDLSQELPLNTNNHEGISQKMYSSMS